MKNCILALAILAGGVSVPAWAQNPDLFVDPNLLVPVPQVTSSASIDQILAERQRVLPEIKSRAAQINAKLQALTRTNLALGYMTPGDRSKAGDALRVQAQALQSAETQGLRYCIINHAPITFADYQSDYTSCASQASEAWKSAEIQQNLFIQNLLEALVFRSRNDLIALQGYQRELGINRLAYGAEIRDFGTKTSELEFQRLLNNPSFQCAPGLGTVRLDEPSQVAGREIPMTMQNVLVQDQGPLGTCYANAASVALETLTGQPNSAVDLAIRFSMSHTAADQEISPDFGGSFCGAVQIAQTQGLCRRDDSWIEAGTASVSSTGKSLPLLFAFLGKKGRLSRGDLALMIRESSSLVNDILGLVQGTAIPTLESPMLKNINSLLNFWVSNHQLSTANHDRILQDLRTYESAHADEYLPKSGRYYKDSENADQALMSKHLTPMMDIVKRYTAPLLPTYVENQLRPYLSQGFSQLVGNYALDQFRTDLSQYRVMQAMVDARLKGAEQPGLTESMVVDIVTLIQMSKKANPGSPLVSETITQALFASQSKNINQALLDTIAPNCQSASRRYTLPAMSCKDAHIQSAAWLTAKILQAVSHGRPLGISYCAEVLGQKLGPVSRVNGCGGHESLLTGVRYNATSGKCDALIWNSWGKVSGKTWIDAERLLPYAMGVQEIAPAVSE